MTAEPTKKPEAEITSDMVDMMQGARLIAEGLMLLDGDEGIERFVKVHVFKNGHLLVWAELSKKTNPVLRDAITTINPYQETVAEPYRFSRSNDGLPWLAELRWEDLLQKGREE